jgi:hypothetical protein
MRYHLLADTLCRGWNGLLPGKSRMTRARTNKLTSRRSAVEMRTRAKT